MLLIPSLKIMSSSVQAESIWAYDLEWKAALVLMCGRGEEETSPFGLGS